MRWFIVDRFFKYQNKGDKTSGLCIGFIGMTLIDIAIKFVSC